MIDQAGWGSTKLYPDGGLSGVWQPEYIVIHWGGLTSQVTPDKEDDVLRGWQRFHTGKGWRDIAYNYAIGDSGNMYRLRGENPGGATTGTAPNGLKWNATGVSIVWIGGKSDVNGPSAAAQATMTQYLRSRQLPALGHVQTGKATRCPGQDWLDYVEDYNKGEGEMPRVLFEGMIDALFAADGEFQGDPNYWKALIDDPFNAEWEDFWAAFTRMVSRS